MSPSSKIYVAGHRGLVGSALLKNLRNKGYTNFATRTSAELDLRDPVAVDAFFEEEKPEYVFLAAAKVGGIVANNTYRGEFLYDNLMIQNNVIESSRKHSAKKLLFLGSTCIYPKKSPQPMKEEYLLTGPLEYTNEPYAIAKIAGLKLCESYNLQYGTNYIAVMPTNLYGPNDNFDLEKSHVLPALIRKIHLGKALQEDNWEAIAADLRKRPIEGHDGSGSREAILELLGRFGIRYSNDEKTNVEVEIWGSGRPMREFLWSEDMADACVHIMETVDFGDIVKLNDVEDEVRNVHLNIGTGKEISIRELAEFIRQTTDFDGELYFNTSKPDGTLRKLTDPSKLHQLGWKHRVELEEGVQRMYAWYLNENA